MRETSKIVLSSSNRPTGGRQEVPYTWRISQENGNGLNGERELVHKRDPTTTTTTTMDYRYRVYRDVETESSEAKKTEATLGREGLALGSSPGPPRS